MANDKKIVKLYGKIANRIISLEPQMRELSDSELANKTDEFKELIKNGTTLDELLVDAYAVVREAARRILGLNTYYVQLIGAIILHNGDIAEMRTGEGKTLTGIFPAYLNALSGDGVHIVTVNEYLSKRDSEINGLVFNFLKITVGLNGRALTKDQKRFAYSQDVTYTTNSELGFDYLRDNMVLSFAQKAQRGLNYAIIDEADSVLIDEARTPLIISGGSLNRSAMYKHANQFAKSLVRDNDLDFDLESRQVFLNDSGMDKAHSFFSIKNLFAVENTELFHLIMNALRANYIFKEGIEYTVRDGQIVLIDQFTGRIMEGRSYSDGLQQALQAKENVEVEEETSVVATITYQNFYRLYNKISGMTGTAKTEEEEFLKIYNTRVVVVPTNKEIIRVDQPDLTFATKGAMFKHLVKDITEIHETGNPILIGTTSVESSEAVANVLRKANLKFEMINAKNHEREAEIIEKAGQRQAITLATNMAGRGTDIKLGEGIATIGGLYVLGIERNEARRIDNQLRGRSGRQGDPGLSRFYISMEDELMVRFTSPKIRKMFLRLGDDYIKSRMFTRAITNAQKKLEGLNFDQRKNVLDYDNVLAQHREAMYAQRDDILKQEDLDVVISKFIYTKAYELINDSAELVRGQQTINVEHLISQIEGKYVESNSFKKADFVAKEQAVIAKMIADQMIVFYKKRMENIPPQVLHEMQKRMILQAFDDRWTKHINMSTKLRSGIYLQQYAQNNPLNAYVEEAARLYNQMKISIADDVIERLMTSTVRPASQVQTAPAQQQVPLLTPEVLKNFKSPVGTVSGEMQAGRPVINISEKDIEKIFEEINIKREESTPASVHAAFDSLRGALDPEKDQQKISELSFKENILVGFMQRFAAMQLNQQHPNQQHIQINHVSLKRKFESYQINTATATAEEVKTAITSAIEKAKVDNVPAQQIQFMTMDLQILPNVLPKFNEVEQKIKTTISQESNPVAQSDNQVTTDPKPKAKPKTTKTSTKKQPVNQTEFVVEDASGKVTKTIKISDDKIDDVEDSEQVQTKTKIG